MRIIHEPLASHWIYSGPGGRETTPRVDRGPQPCCLKFTGREITGSKHQNSNSLIAYYDWRKHNCPPFVLSGEATHHTPCCSWALSLPRGARGRLAIGCDRQATVAPFPNLFFVQNFSCVQLLVIEPKIFMTKVMYGGW